MDCENLNLSEEILQKAEEAELSTVPKVSEGTYKKEFDKFAKWMLDNNAEVITEKVLLAYFLDQVK